MEVTLFRSAGGFLAPRSTRRVAAARSQRFKNGIKMADSIIFAANHLAVAALQSPHAAAGADINIVNAFCRKLLGAANVVDVIRVPAVDDDVAGLQLWCQVMQGGIDYAGRNH